MQPSAAPGIELSKAFRSIAQMEQASSVEEFEDAWKGYLHCIERCFNKAAAHFKKSPKWDAWWGKYKSLRTKDELLSYLVNARGADEHSVEEIVSREGAGITINPAFGDVLYFDHFSMDGTGNISFSAPLGAKIEFIPERMVLIPVKNRGRIYPVPTIHMGAMIDPCDVPRVARLAHGFYAQFLSEADNYFVK